jgi:hypothetical protein
MKVGSIVECVTSFEHLKKTWGFPYPKYGDILTVCLVEPHPKKECRDKGILKLYFEEIRTIGLANKTVYGKPNFKELEVIPQEEVEKLSNSKVNEVLPH